MAMDWTTDVDPQKTVQVRLKYKAVRLCCQHNLVQVGTGAEESCNGTCGVGSNVKAVAVLDQGIQRGGFDQGIGKRRDLMDPPKVHHTELEKSDVEAPFIVDMVTLWMHTKPGRMPDLSF